MTAPRARRGVVLATSLYYLAVLALLVVGTIYAARGARTGADGATIDATLAGALDHALARALAEWRAADRASQSVGSKQSIAIEPFRGAAGTASITRLGPALYWVSAEARMSGNAALRRRATLLVRALVPQPLVQSPIVSQGNVIVGAAARIVSDSEVPEDCPTPPSAVLALAPDAELRLDGARDSAERIATLRLPDVEDPETYERFGAESWSTLAARADVRLPADTSLTPAIVAHASCITARAADDWGDRTAADGCIIAPPIIVAAGDLTIAGGAGSGIVLVQGRLRITGPFAFRGVIVARGGVEITGDGADITGSVLAARLTTTDAAPSAAALVVNGRAQLRASSCTAYRVFASRAGVRSVRARAWLERL